MSVNFDRVIHREDTHSLKFDGRQRYFGTADVTPLWVADMDFAVAKCVSRALQQRAEHPVFGYTFYPDSLYESIMEWFKVRHGWEIEREWILMAPGVVPSLFAAVQAFTQPGDEVIVQPPVYFPFFSAVTTNHRRVVENPLVSIAGRYEMDMEHLERCAAAGARLMFLCTPHNPVGRVWTEEELQNLLAIARRHQVTIISDDIHCDLVYPGERHRMLASLAQPGDRIITAIAPNKTFNIPGLGLSALVIPDNAQRAALTAVFESLHMGNTNPFSIVAFEAAYRGGAPWLDALMEYLADTRDYVSDFLQREIPAITLVKPEATYLLWLDCRALGLADAPLKTFFIEQAGLGLNPGAVFGTGGSGFMRMNIGVRRAVIQQSLLLLKSAVSQLSL